MILYGWGCYWLLRLLGLQNSLNWCSSLETKWLSLRVDESYRPLLAMPYKYSYVPLCIYCMRGIYPAVNAFFIYFFTGFFGAAYYGQETSDDILENQWLGGGVAQGCLNISMAGKDGTWRPFILVSDSLWPLSFMLTSMIDAIWKEGLILCLCTYCRENLKETDCSINWWGSWFVCSVFGYS